MTATFCGHRTIEDQTAISKWLDTLLPALIEGGVSIFYLGGYGTFDVLAAKAVWRQKVIYPGIKAILVLPYANQSIDTSCYDKTIYPISEAVPPRYAIIERNRWMVKKANIVISGVNHSWGGAAKTLAYARQERRVVLQYPTVRRE